MRVRSAIQFVLVSSLVWSGGCTSRVHSERANEGKRSAFSSTSPTPANASSPSGVNPPASGDGAPTHPSSASTEPAPLTESASPLYFTDQRNGWVLLGDAFYRTRDGGKAWAKLNRHPLRNYVKIIFVNEQKGYALRDDWGTKSRSNTILGTEDGGRTWHQVLELPTPVYSINFINSRIGYVSSRWYPIQHTVNGGKTWGELDGIEGLNYVYFVSEEEGWGYGGAIWHTRDGGETWTQVVPYEQVTDLWGAKFIDKSNGWIIGGGSQLWFTTDGRTWQRAANLPSSEKQLVALDFVSKNEGWVALEDGTIVHTENGGNTWQTITNVGTNLSAINFTSRLNGLAVSKQGRLLRTNDGGRTWAVVALEES